MSFANPSRNLAQDNQHSTLFSLEGEGFAPAATADFEVDLEKQQQHHLRQFLYFQGLALQRSEEQQREQRVQNFGDIDGIYNDTRTSPDTLSSGSVEDHLHDFITIESLSDTSVSAPSTPDLLGTNIPSLACKAFASADLDLSPTSYIQTPSNSMTGAPSPLQDASENLMAGMHPRDLELQSKAAGRPLYDQFGDLTNVLTVGAQYPLFHGQGVGMHHLIPNAAGDVMPGSSSQLQAQAARHRSFSIATPYANQFTQPAMSPYYVSNHPSSYQQLYLTGCMPHPGMFNGSTMVPIDSNQHQRTFSLPMGNIPVPYFNAGIPLPAHTSFNVASGEDNIIRESRRSSLFETSAPSRCTPQEHRPKPYDRAESTVSRSSVSRTPAVPNAESPAQKGSSGSSTPAIIIPENLKDVPASMIRNPHGGGRGYVPGETQEDPKKRHKCGICGRGFARLYNLKVCIPSRFIRPRPNVFYCLNRVMLRPMIQPGPNRMNALTANARDRSPDFTIWNVIVKAFIAMDP